MTKFTTSFNNFIGGKISEKFKGRFDTKDYFTSVEEYLNMFTGKIGGAYKRTGTVLVHDLTNLSSGFTDTHTSIPFDTGRGFSYTLYLPNTTVKIDGGLSSDLYIILNDGAGLTSPTAYEIGSGITLRVAPVIPAWPSANAVTFTEGQWVWQQVGDLLFLTHTSGEQRPLVLSRTSVSTFDLNYFDSYQTETENLNIALRVPYKKNLSAITMNLATATTIASSAAYFTAKMVGSYIRVNKAVSSGVYVITAFSSTTLVTVAKVAGSTIASGATDDWDASVWHDENGWPTSVTHHQNRLFWGGSGSKNFDTIWASLLFNLFHMMRERLDQDSSTDSSGLNFFGDISIGEDPTDFKPASTQTNSITWLSGGRVLMCGTTGGENLIKLGVDALDVSENSNYGSHNSQVVKAGKDVIFVGKDRRSIRSYRYSEDNGSWVSDDLSAKADTLFLDGAILSSDIPTIKQLSWNSETKQLWIVLSNFSVKVLTYDPEFGLNGWTDFEIGGETVSNVLGVSHIRSPDRSRIETYLTVSRRMEGVSGNRVYLEKIMGEFNNTSINSFSSTDLIDYPRFLDFAVLDTADGSGVVQLGPDYTGNTMDVIYITADSVNYALGVDVLNFGELDFTFPAGAKVLSGYLYLAELATLPPEAGGQYGTSLADIKSIHESTLKLYRTMNYSIGSKDKRSGTDLNFEEVSFDDLTTTDDTRNPSDNPDTDGQIIIRSTTPTPLNILALINKGVSYD